MTNEKRPTKTEDIGVSYCYLSEIIKDVDEIIKTYPHLTYDDFWIEAVDNGYNDDFVAKLFYSRPVTDEEWEVIKQRHEAGRKAIEAYEKAQYLRLKEQFEPSS